MRTSITLLTLAVVAMTLILATVRPARAAEAAAPKEVSVWPAGTHGVADEAGPTEKTVDRGKPEKPDRSTTGVRHPTLTLYQPEKASGAAVIICPGGGYGGLALDKEGHDMARWLNSIGVTGIVLKYRLPVLAESKGETPWPVQDIQRSIRLVRAHAQGWGVDPKRVGVMGFSAGGHLASTAATHFDGGKADAADAVDQQSCRPDFVILGYPVVTFKGPFAHTGSRNNLIGKDPDPALIDLYSNELQVTPQTPPTFIVHAKDDPVKVGNSIQFKEAMDKVNVPCHLELYETGGHGFGLGVHGGEVATWPGRCQAWLKEQKIIP